jgi:hypothetical protein
MSDILPRRFLKKKVPFGTLESRFSSSELKPNMYVVNNPITSFTHLTKDNEKKARLNKKNLCKGFATQKIPKTYNLS